MKTFTKNGKQYYQRWCDFGPREIDLEYYNERGMEMLYIIMTAPLWIIGKIFDIIIYTFQDVLIYKEEVKSK
jgi:hypothetical protein